MKPKKATDAMKDYFSDEFSPENSAKKLPINVTGGVEPLSDFMNIPCDRIVPYQAKKDSDFEEWPAEKFLQLVESISENGVIEPVTVRPLPNSPDKYEMLAGEHRWKASMQAKKKTVPAHVLRDCSDETAAYVFSVTNVLRRDNRIRDLVNGWWQYTQAVRFKSAEKIQALVDEGIISADVQDKAEKAQRTIRRYASMHNLIDELLDLADQKKISIVVGEHLSIIDQDKQEDLLPYRKYLNNAVKAQKLKSLAKGELEDSASTTDNPKFKEWNQENIEEILFSLGKGPDYSLRGVSTRIKATLKNKVSKSAYKEVEALIEETVDTYLQEHPDKQASSKSLSKRGRRKKSKSSDAAIIEGASDAPHD